MTADPRAETVSDLGEEDLLKRIAARLPKPARGEVWSGDDAAVLHSPPDRLLLTTDVLVEGRDFDFSYCSGEDVGWKAVAANASDVAAMGGRPLHAVVSLALVPETRVDVVDEIVEGITDAARRWGIDLVGGDISSAGEMSVSVTLTGTPVGRDAILRSGAVPGQALCVTGALGGAAGGLWCLRNLSRRDTTSEAVRRLVLRQLRPIARLAEAAELVAAGATAMIDISDGLAVDLGHVMDASATGCTVETAAVPLDPDLAEIATESVGGAFDPVEGAILGGEDFELLVALDEAGVSEAEERLSSIGTRFSRIGTVTHGPSRIGDEPLDDWRSRGWDHLRVR